LESNRELIETMGKLDKSFKYHSKWLIWLTMVLVVLTVVLVVFAVLMYKAPAIGFPATR